MHLENHELSLLSSALIDRRIMLKEKRLNSGRDDRLGAAYQTMITATSRLENKLYAEQMRRERAENRLVNLRSQNRL